MTGDGHRARSASGVLSVFFSWSQTDTWVCSLCECSSNCTLMFVYFSACLLYFNNIRRKVIRSIHNIERISAYIFNIKVLKILFHLKGSYRKINGWMFTKWHW